MQFFEIPFNKDMALPYTAEAFLLGYIINALSSWLESFYYWTWKGKPSTKLLRGVGTWKIKFYTAEKVRTLLLEECSTENPDMDELFSCALRKISGEKEGKVEDLNSGYAFSRSLLTTGVIGIPFVLYQHASDIRFFLILLPLLFVLWLRAKQRAYFYAREVLNSYLKLKQL